MLFVTTCCSCTVIIYVAVPSFKKSRQKSHIHLHQHISQVQTDCEFYAGSQVAH